VRQVLRRSVSFHGESICQAEDCGLRVIRDYYGFWYHDARDLRSAGYVLDGEVVEPHRAVPDPIVVYKIAQAYDQGRARAEQLARDRAAREAAGEDLRHDA